MSEQTRALVLDFDGLVADTEVLWLAVLRRLYQSLSQELPHDLYVASIGGTLHDFDPFEDLAARCGTTSAAELEVRGEALFRAWMAYEAPLPGARRLVAEAERRGLPLAIASSSRSASVVPHLDAFGLLGSFTVIVTAEDVPQVKPAPDLYLLAARRLGVDPTDIVAFEDSNRGVRAARAAGAFCVAVPHALSRSHDFGAADLRLDSLALCDLDDLLSLSFEKRKAHATSAYHRLAVRLDGTRPGRGPLGRRRRDT
ncbi:HAD family hydrolase [Streptomyces sp. SP18CS02]|uniref:HAD family hydrolase n=1 Tax=Streptomyces sp. SP18CS02 TaxID=3002531 RepID=UPI002E76EB62|nr:HAD-IA family hydrolase [Streptomyces sp. SP18CS02]MEE1754449.1 HAD-IA family hydrolase [Streptomyces sp. SP18CS02]